MFTDYSSLQTEITDWYDRSDLSTKAATFISFGESRIYRDLRVRQMEKAFSDTIASNVVAVPSDYLEMKNFRIVSSPDRPLDRLSVWELYDLYGRNGYTGIPAAYARDETNFVFGPVPDSTYSVAGTYYAKLASLSSSNTSNWLITDTPDLIFAASMKECAAYTMDAEAVGYWEDRYQTFKAMIQSTDDREGHSGSPPVSRSV